MANTLHVLKYARLVQESLGIYLILRVKSDIFWQIKGCWC